MARTSNLPVPAQPERVDYDGCYLITAVSKTGQVFKTYSRGYKLKSWLSFEQSLGSTAGYQAVTEEEFEKHQWYNQSYEEEPVVKKAKKSAPAKKAVKTSAAKKPQYSRDDGALTKTQLKQIKKTPKTVAKKPQKKAAKKS